MSVAAAAIRPIAGPAIYATYNTSMNVCFVSHSSGKYGAEKALIELILGLRQRGVTCHVILPKRGPLADELGGLGIPFRVLPYKRWTGKGNGSRLWKRITRAFFNLIAATRLAATIRRWKCDIVYTNTITICVGALAARLSGRTHIWHIHEFGYEGQGLLFDFGERFSTWLMDRLSSVCIANSNAVADKYKRYITERKVKVVYQSVTVPEMGYPRTCPNEKAGRFKCAIVGSLQEGKGQEDAIRAVAELRSQGVGIELVIIGDTTKDRHKKRLHGVVTELGLSEQVTFMGYLADPFPAMDQADAILVCARFEAFGRTTIEAMLLGKPVIGADSGGTTELIHDGSNGLLYTAGDHEQLAAKIKYLHDNPDDARRMGHNGQAWAKDRFTKDLYAEEVLSILHKSMASN